METQVQTLPGLSPEAQAKFPRVSYLTTEDSCPTNKAKNSKKEKYLKKNHADKEGEKPGVMSTLAMYCDTHGIGNTIKTVSVLNNRTVQQQCMLYLRLVLRVNALVIDLADRAS